MKEPRFYLNTEYVKLIEREKASNIPRIEFDNDIVKLYLNNSKDIQYGRFYFYDDKNFDIIKDDF